jgi:aryl-alcohol dehydrogenase-like predicted oxidoreductase
MEYLKIKGIDRDCSRFIIGTMTIKDPDGPESEFKKLDDAWEQGVNVIDAAHSYGAPRVGSTEIALGKWVKSRGLKREDYVITTKCAHPRYFDRNPFLQRTAVHSYDMESELHDSLTKWHADYVDVLYLHRDDPNTTVAEIIETLNKFKKQGLVKVFGAANWQVDRIKEANDYAEAHGLQGFGIVEEHYSLAEMVGDPFMQGSGSLSGPKYKDAIKYLVGQGISCASYSALSGGFCTGRVTREQFEKDPDSVPGNLKIGYCYPDNFTRMERATELAAAKGLTVPQVCMAYTMSGELDVMPIIGARNHEELMSTLSTQEIKLSKAECDWIDLTSDERPF